MALGNPSWDPTPLQRDVPSSQGREHGHTSSSPRGSVISNRILTCVIYLVIGTVLEVFVSSYRLLHLDCIRLTLYSTKRNLVKKTKKFCSYLFTPTLGKSISILSVCAGSRLPYMRA